MDENLEYKLDQLKMGIGELLARVSASGSEDPQELREQLAGMILNDIKRVMEEKHNFIQEQLYSFENLVKNVLQNSDTQKMLVETSRISADLNTVYTKLSAQEMLLQNMYKLVDNLKNDKTPELIDRLNNEFVTFSRGFENITAALNRNFTEFLAQVQTQSAREEIKKLSIDLDGINSNTNAVLSALSIIDHKTQDLKGLMNLVADKDNSYIEGLQELSRMGAQFGSFAEGLKALPTREDSYQLNEKIAAIATFLNNLKGQFESVDNEQKARMADLALSIEARFSKLSEGNDQASVQKELQALYLQLSSISDAIRGEVVNKLADFAKNISQQTSNSHAIFAQEMNVLKNNINNLNDEVRDFKTGVNSIIENKTQELFAGIQGLNLNIGSLKSHIGEGEITLEIAALSRGMENLQAGLESYRVSLSETNKDNTAILKELVENALSNIENLKIGTQLKQLAIAVDQSATNIKETFKDLGDNFAQISETTNIEVLKQLNTSIPEIADKLEIFKTVIASENEKNISEMQTKMTEVISEAKISFDLTSQQLTEKIETNATNVSYELVEQKTNLGKLITTIEVLEKDFVDRFKEITKTIEELNQGNSIEKLREDVLAQILVGFENSRTNTANVCEKIAADIEAKISTSSGLISQNVSELKTALTQMKEELEEKIERGSVNSHIVSKIQELMDSEASYNEILRVSDKTTVQKIEDLVNEIVELKEKIELPPKPVQEPINADALKEFISGLEFLQSNFVDDMKDEFKIHQDVLKKLRDEEVNALDEVNLKKVIQDTIEYKMGEIKGREKSNYSLDDIESDFAKLRILLEEEQKEHLPERLEEIRNIGLENIRLNKQSEKHINTVVDWLDSTSKIIQILSDKVEKAEKLSIQEIKTRLVKTETPSSSEGINENLEEFRVEINKKYQIQEMKIENIDEKLTTLVQKQGDIIDMKSFVEAFHENSTQTKSLLARVEGIENQINTMSGSLEKIISYIEE